MKVEYSVIIPFKDEEGNIRPLIAEVEEVMEGLKKSWELICIEDGSTDSTRDELFSLMQQKPYMRLIVFNRNYGQSSALDAGFKEARGCFVITLDGDMQNDPRDIPKLLTLVDSADLVCGQRVKRRDSFFKRWISRLANTTRSRVCRDGIQDTGCSLKVYRTAALRSIKMYQGMHRFLPALFLNEGFCVTEVPVNHRERQQGKTKYNIFNRSFNTIADMLAVRWMGKRRLRYMIEQKLP